MQVSLKQLGLILNQEGTARQERYLPALRETANLLDKRKWYDIILYIHDYSRNLRFVNTESESIYFDSWENFFADDEFLLIAHMARAGEQKTADDYDRLRKLFEKDPTIGSFATLVRYVFSRFVQIDEWYKKAPVDSMPRSDIHLNIQSYLKQEMEKLRELLLYCFDHEDDDIDLSKRHEIEIKKEKTRENLQYMDAVWDLSKKEKTKLREEIFSGDRLTDKLISAAVHLQDIFDSVYYVTQTITGKSDRYYNATILKQDHPPHVALIITFIKLFAYQQTELNKIPQTLLNFYYRDVLKIKAKSAIPDQAHIIFELTKGFDSFLLKKGTRLFAGKDKQNNELVYQTDKDVFLSNAQVSYLRTAFIDKTEKEEVLNYYAQTIKPLPELVKTAPGEVMPTPIFGEKDPTSITEIGFAIASSQLYLAKGKRDVVITLKNEKVTEANTGENQGNDAMENFCEKSIFKLLLSGEKGWVSSEDNSIELNDRSLQVIDNSILVLSFTIPISQEQAIVAFDKKLHEGNFTTDLPVMQFVLKFPPEKDPPANADKLIQQLNFLQKFQVTNATIKVMVGTQKEMGFDGVRDLILENDESILDSTKPFYPFTPVPKVSGAFYIGCPDLYYKQIKQLSVNIEWLLPDNFKAHYQKYNPPYDTNKFIATLSYLDGKKWKKYADVSLIEANSSDPRLRNISMNLDNPNFLDEPLSTYDNVKSNGTIKLKLRYPDFGHSVYPQLITSIVMEKATQKSDDVDYFKVVKHRLGEDTFTIVLPDGVDDRDSDDYSVMYDILEFQQDDNAKTMLINYLSALITRKNGIEIVPKKPGDTKELVDPKDSAEIVHDSNFWENTILWVYRKVTGRDVHLDKDEQDVEEKLKGVEKDINKVADFILPSKREMINLIVNEVNKIINQTVTVIVENVLDLRDSSEDKKVNPDDVKKIFDDEFIKARKVVNDMIAKKIATFLATNEIPPPPYSPLINNISLNYVSTKIMSRLDKDNVKGDKFFQLTPMGGAVETTIWKKDNMMDAQLPVKTWKKNTAPVVIVDGKDQDDLKDTLYQTNFMFPQPLEVKLSPTSVIHLQGILFIGIKDLLPDQNLSLLFHVLEGTKNNDKKPPAIYWFYLRHNEWVNIPKDDIISDSTYELQTTGIIEFAIPADADNSNTYFNIPSKYWLAVGVNSTSNAFPYISDVKAQAAGVTFVDYKNNPMHMAVPLPAEKIKILLDEVPEVKKINQPAASFNGKVGEKENEYYTRVSERLRHKERAINNWDYENLVLERFPAIFKVKCLNNYYNGNFARGHVTIVPIADLRNKSYEGSSILVPKTNYIDLIKIEEYLCSIASPFAKIHAINPKLEYIHVTCKVKFLPGRSKGYYLKQLNLDIINFLTPWANDPGRVTFSGKVYASSIINFIDKREYVDYVQELEMRQYTENDKGVKEYVVDPYELLTMVETRLTTNHSVLVSAPKHDIDLVPEDKITQS